MHVSYGLMAWITLVVGTFCFAGNKESIIEKKFAVTLKKKDLLWCQKDYQRGYVAAYSYYLQLAPTCSDYYLNAPILNGFFMALDSKVISMDNLVGNCFQLGWQSGFLQSHFNQWQPCAKELDASLQVTYQHTLERCSALGKNVSEDLHRRLQQWLNEFSPQEMSSQEFAIVKYLLFGLLKHGDYQGVWQEILAINNEKIEKLPCFSVFNNNLERLP